MDIIKIKTYKCTDCKYRQDFEPTEELMTKHFGKSNNVCPSCFKGTLVIEEDEAKKINVKIATDKEIDDMDIDEEKKTEYKAQRITDTTKFNQLK